MKRLWLLTVLAALLCGCSAADVYETVTDNWEVPVSASIYRLQLQLPEEAAGPTMGSGEEQMYLCENFSVCVQTFDAGDTKRTIQQITGLDPDMITVINTRHNDFPAYEFVWTAAGEGEQQICRGLVIDDGSQHHAVTVMSDYQLAGDLSEQWDHIMDSAILISTG